MIVTLCMTHFTIASVTIYLHRHQAHRALDLRPACAFVFRLWLWLTTGMTTKNWAAIHRKHHAFVDQIGDPHSPQTVGLWTVLSRGAELYREEGKDPETLEKYGHGTPDTPHRHPSVRCTPRARGSVLEAGRYHVASSSCHRRQDLGHVHWRVRSRVPKIQWR